MKEKTNLKKLKVNIESFGDVESYKLKKQKILFNSLTHKWNPKEQRGITLITLVVTVIVLLILAGISIQMLTGDNGILKRASEAKTKSTATNEEEKIQLAAMEALTNGVGTINKSNLEQLLKSALGLSSIELTGIGPWTYIGADTVYHIQTDGSIVTGWGYVYDSNGYPTAVTNGTMTIEIGKTINYDPGTEAKQYTSEKGIDTTTESKITTYKVGENADKTAALWTGVKAEDYQDLINSGDIVSGNGSGDVKFEVSDADGIKWKVLGVDEKTGELLIVTSDILSKKLTLCGIIGYMYGVNELNNICNVYGQGYGATGGRSITLEDVNKAIGMPNTIPTTKYTCFWNQNTLTKNSPRYCVNNTASTTYLRYSHKIYNQDKYIFNFYNESTNKWETSEKTAVELTAMGDKEETIATITYTWRGYSSITDTQKATKGYSVVFQTGTDTLVDITKGDENHVYWLGSSYVDSSSGEAYWGIHYVGGTGYVGNKYLYHSMGFWNSYAIGVRSVVSLRSDIQLEKASGESTTYDYEISK